VAVDTGAFDSDEQIPLFDLCRIEANITDLDIQFTRQEGIRGMFEEYA
jgi:hypothetical protein